MAGIPRALALFALFAAVSTLTRAVVLDVPVVDTDEASYLVGAREMLRGRLLYAEIADHKPPLVYAYYALAQGAGSGMVSVRLLTSLLVLPLTALALSAVFAHDRRGMFAGLGFLISSASFLAHDMLAVNCEVLMLLPLSWALVVLQRGACRVPASLAAGLLIGLATLFKYQAALWLPAPVLAVALAGSGPEGGASWPRRWRQAVATGTALLAGFALPLLASYSLFAAWGAGQDFLYWNLVHNFRYAESTVAPRQALERALVYGLSTLTAMAPLWWAWGQGRQLLPPRLRALVWALLLLSLLSACLGYRFYPHYFIPVYVPLALGAAPALALLLRTPMRVAGRGLLACSGLLLVGFTLANALLYHGRHQVYSETRPVFGEVAAAMRADPCWPARPIFVWGYAPAFYLFADRPVASRFLFVESTLVGYVSGRAAGDADPRLVRPQHWDWLLADLQSSRPAYILDTSAAGIGNWQFPIADYPRLARFVAEGYELRATVGGVALYRRRGCPAAVSP
jgi:4-amino-4-deoxy-L-arabinose transferase-like glycosyltransferase